jgi:L-ascorbate metabolism protein UlaG (beta-lactamase superfamily)
MKVKWLGHSSFLITSEEGTRIITDPYSTGGGINYAEINESADIVAISHQHSDHNNAAGVSGNPEVVAGSQKAKGIEFRGIVSYHDTARGKQRGTNTILCFTIDGINICHLGDLGHQLDNRQVAEIGAVDILLIPVGGYFTIDAKTASQVVFQLKPKVVIPMHYKTDKCDYPIAKVADFLTGKKNVRQFETSEIEFRKGDLPPTAEIVVLKPAR